MATKYEVLAALIEADHDRWGSDDLGLHHVIKGVVGVIAQTHGSEEELADAVYELIADSYVPTAKNGDEVENQVDQT